ncbi:murein hydrolase activator EnvC [Thermoactinomyces sp. CICC 10523]|uniref:murein hydrolase activator EnvC family protein n=1 Tax=Thermoactinomyces sp. CICC 10523 TaxID=2767428 RepID=UPI0018DDC2F0|nr:peptidoglycan DD-metalloendopeptidase family protein [Thermoactinomyces sp. CICC 10523]MBH8597279.1 peptidoglycan DD-metalloendopeptidase family protein [Thermoactinomyces sp. CICC 10523]
MKRKLIISVLTVCLTISLTPGPLEKTIPTAYATSKAEEGKQKLKDIKSKQSESKAEIAKVQKLIDEKQKGIHEIEARAGALNDQIAKLNKNIEANKKVLEQSRQSLGNKLKRIYLQGSNSYMAQLFAADSFSDFLKRYEVLRLIVESDYQVFNEYMTVQKNLEKQQAELNEKQKSLAAEMEKANEAVKQYEAELDKHKSELEEYEKQENAVLKQYAGYFNSGSGQLGWPTTPGMVYWNYMQFRGNHYHKGDDFPRPKGTPIFAAESGTVLRVSTSDPDGYGVYIDIQHPNGLQTRYAHMFLSTVTVHAGQHVSRGQKIAEVGNNGRFIGATGYHLHFEVWKNGHTVNPKPYLQ